MSWFQPQSQYAYMSFFVIRFVSNLILFLRQKSVITLPIPKSGAFAPFFGIESDIEIRVELQLPELLIGHWSQFCKR